MTIDQYIRRLVWRIRRRIGGGGADNDPIVTLEPPEERRALVGPPLVRVAFSPAGFLRKYRGAAVAFAITLLVLGGAYVAFIAAQSRVALAPLSESEGASAPARGLAAAAALLALAPDTTLADDTLLAPTARAARLIDMRIGAREAATGFLAAIGPDRGRADAALIEARVLAGEGDTEGARQAVARLAERLDARQARLSSKPAALAALAAQIARDCDAAGQRLSQAVKQGPRGYMDPVAETPFFRARGLAFGWAELLSAWAGDFAGLSLVVQDRLRALVEILQRASIYQPWFVANPGPHSLFGPNHLALLGLDIAAAAAAARDLEAALEG